MTKYIETETIKVLNECIDLQRKKSQDYQNPNSTVKRADHFVFGLESIHTMIHIKTTRAAHCGIPRVL